MSEQPTSENPPGVATNQVAAVAPDYSASWAAYYSQQQQQQQQQQQVVQQQQQQQQQPPQQQAVLGGVAVQPHATAYDAQSQQQQQQQQQQLQYSYYQYGQMTPQVQQQYQQPVGSQAVYQYPTYQTNQGYVVGAQYQQQHYPVAYDAHQTGQQIYQVQPVTQQTEASAEKDDVQPPGLSEVDPPLPEDPPAIPGLSSEPAAETGAALTTAATDQQAAYSGYAFQGNQQQQQQPQQQQQNLAVQQQQQQQPQQQQYGYQTPYYTYGYQDWATAYNAAGYSTAPQQQQQQQQYAVVASTAQAGNYGVAAATSSYPVGVDAATQQQAGQLFTVAANPWQQQQQQATTTPAFKPPTNPRKPKKSSQTSAFAFYAAKNSNTTTADQLQQAALTSPLPSPQNSPQIHSDNATGTFAEGLIGGGGKLKEGGGGRVPFVIKKQMSKGAMKSASSRFAASKERKVAFVRVEDRKKDTGFASLLSANKAPTTGTVQNGAKGWGTYTTNTGTQPNQQGTWSSYPAATPAAAAPEQQASPENRILAPNSFYDYKKRVMAAYTSKEGKLKAEMLVQMVLEKAHSAGQVWVTDWAKQPRPSEEMFLDGGASFSFKPAKGQSWNSTATPKSRFSDFPTTGTFVTSSQPFQSFTSSSIDLPKNMDRLVSRINKQGSSAARSEFGKSSGGSKGKRMRKEGNLFDDPWAMDTDVGNNNNNSRGRSKTGKRRKRSANKAAAAANLDSDADLDPTERMKRLKRLARFGNGQASGASGGTNNNRGGQDMDWDEVDAVQGTCQELEKSFIRLSDAPDASSVRPEPVLRRALDRLVGLLRGPGVKYFYTSDQFKGMRQDCFVQRLQNDLAVEIYEAHGRAALEYGDLWEYNQCQALLVDLYAAGVGGCEAEFLAYRLLYQGFHMKKGEGPSLRKTLWKVEQLEKKGVELPEVAHAKEVISVTCALNPLRFFELYVSAPKLSRALMDEALESVRFQATKQFASSYRHGSIPLSFMALLLGFLRPEGVEFDKEEWSIPPGCSCAHYAGKANMKDSEEEGVVACQSWLEAHGAVVQGNASGNLMFMPQESKPKLFVPKEENAVAHGDANLTLGNFLTRRIS